MPRQSSCKPARSPLGLAIQARLSSLRFNPALIPGSSVGSSSRLWELAVSRAAQRSSHPRWILRWRLGSPSPASARSLQLVNGCGRGGRRCGRRGTCHARCAAYISEPRQDHSHRKSSSYSSHTLRPLFPGEGRRLSSSERAVRAHQVTRRRSLKTGSWPSISSYALPPALPPSVCILTLAPPPPSGSVPPDRARFGHGRGHEGQDPRRLDRC